LARVGEIAVGLPVGLHLLDRERIEERSDHGPCHAVAAVDDDLHGADPGRVDVAQRGAPELGGDIVALDRAGRAGGFAGLAGHDLARLADPGVPGERDRAAPHQLGGSRPIAWCRTQSDGISEDPDRNEVV
jgi:hypothetical protein